MAADAGAPARRVNNVVKTYGTIGIVDGVTFTTAAGEFVALPIAKPADIIRFPTGSRNAARRQSQNHGR
jgi:hypothetical protein